MAGLFLYPITAATMRCMGLYCVRGIGIYPAYIMPVVGRSMAFYSVLLFRVCSYTPAAIAGRCVLSLGCSLLTGARGAFNRVVFCVLAVLSRARNAIDSGRGTAWHCTPGGGTRPAAVPGGSTVSSRKFQKE